MSPIGNISVFAVKNFIMPIHKAGYPFIGIAIAMTLITALFWSGIMGLICLAITLWVVYFFRDPPRMTPTRADLIVAPADGLIQPIIQAVPPAELNMGDTPLTRISICLSLWDVHINRVPASGQIDVIKYHPGQFLNASLDKASQLNERMSYLMHLPDQRPLAVVQIAGLISRRILSFVGEGQIVKAGERLGLIRFGSRCDIYMPTGLPILVVPGQRAIAGETVLVDLQSPEKSRGGEVR